MRLALLLFALPLGVVAERQQQVLSPPADEELAGDVPYSPPVYPSPRQDPHQSGPWKEASAKAARVVKGLTLEEKVSLGTGAGWPGGNCFGIISPFNATKSDFSFPGLCLHDGPLGVRAADLVSAFPAGINAAATFDRGLMRARARAIGREYREKGINVYLGPMTNMQRTPLAGRNWEGPGGDPYLSGEATYENIIGVQSQGVQCNVKHFIGNDQEWRRNTISSNIDDRAMHEIYLHPFLRAVQANTASVMASYNRINGSWGTQNSKTINGLLKTELGFQGYVLTDFFGAHSGVSACNAGLDMPVPIGDSFFGENLVEAVRNGSVTQARVDDMATRILSAWYLTGQDRDFPKTNFAPVDYPWPEADEVNNKHVDVQHDHHKVIRAVGAASHVLLKNEGHILPLQRGLRNLILIGSDAGPSPYGPNFYHDRYITPEDKAGALAMGWGSGTSFFPYLIDPLAAIQYRARKEHIDLAWILDDYNLEEAARQAKNKQVALVFITADSGEDTYDIGDRFDLEPWHNGTALVQAVAKVNPNTVVIIHSVGPVNVEPWIENDNVRAVIWAGLQGQELGNALVDVLFGDVAPSGRLPFTWAKKETDYSATVTRDEDDRGQGFQHVDYKEQLLVDYRHFDANDITPRFAFGHGLSYTAFAYSRLRVRALSTHAEAADGVLEAYDAQAVGASTREWLHRPLWEVEVLVENKGKRDGHEVVQLFLEYPEKAGEPPKGLKGFDRVFIRAGQKKKVKLHLSFYSLSIWDVVSQRWVRPRGDFTVHVGASSRDIRLSAPLKSA